MDGDRRRPTLVVLPSGTEFRDAFVRELERLGHEVVVASDWHIALDVSEGRLPDAVVFDPGRSAGLPGWRDGLARLRERWPDLVAVALGGTDSSTR